MRADSHETSLLTSPLALVAVAYACGILAAHFYDGPSKPAIIVVCGGPVAAALLAVLPIVNRKPCAVSTLICFGFICARGAMSLVLRDHPPNSIAHVYDNGWIGSGDAVEVTGVLDQAPELAPDRIYLTLRVEQLRYKGIEHLVFGRILFSASLRERAARAEYDQLGLR